MTPFIERDCVITHEGRTFEAGGAAVTPEWALAYPDIPGGEYRGAFGAMRDWHGNEIGTCRVTARWKTPRSWVSSHMCQIEATIGGVKYTGRGAGSGSLWRGKRVKGGQK
jgi:hypothetical protein